jgi:hypothetical protein
MFLGLDHKDNYEKNMNYIVFHVSCILELELFISEVILNTFLTVGKKKGHHRGKWIPL